MKANSDGIYFGENGPWFKVGIDVNSNRDIYIDVRLLNEHAHVLGKSGSHKSLFEVLLFTFLILFTSAAILFVDHGGDRYAFNKLKLAAKKAGRTFRFLSIDPRHKSHNFDPVKAFIPLVKEFADTVTDYFVSSLSLDPGEGERAYFGKINWSSISLAVSELVRLAVTHPSLADIRDQLQVISRSLRKNDAAESLLAFQQLASLPCLRPATEGSDTEIDYEAVLENREVVYLFLPTLHSPTARPIGGLNLFSLAHAARRREEEGRPGVQAYVGIDEFQQIARDSATFEAFETMTRKHGIGLVMANQSMSQLNGRLIDLRDVISDSTNIKLYLTSNDDYVIEKIQSRSKDIVRELEGRSSAGEMGLNVSKQTRPYITPEFERNECIEASALRFHGILLVDDGKAHHEPLHVRFDPGVTKEEYERIRAISIPALDLSDSLPSSSGPKLQDSDRITRHTLLRELSERIDRDTKYPNRGDSGDK